MQELDEYTKDLCSTLPSQCATTPFYKFKSEPSKIADEYHFFLLGRGKVYATVGYTEDKNNHKDDIDVEDNNDYSEDHEDDDELTGDGDVALSLRHWIVTLQAAMNTGEGLQCILEDPNMRTNIRTHDYDSDCISSYPSDLMALNVSKTTNVREIIGIAKVPETTFRKQNINLLSGPVNAVEYCNYMFGMPELTQLDKIWDSCH